MAASLSEAELLDELSVRAALDDGRVLKERAKGSLVKPVALGLTFHGNSTSLGHSSCIERAVTATAARTRIRCKGTKGSERRDERWEP